MFDSTQRFSSRVDNYIRYRPGYPPEIIEFLKTSCGLQSKSIIADVGSGTGILTEMFLKSGNPVFAIEPNREMRHAAERLLQSFPAFTSIAGTAEETTLPDASVDFVTVGQAFHWFDAARTRQEFRRILLPGGWVVLVWNDRRIDSTAFLAGYEQLLRDYATDYDQVNHKRIDASTLRAFFKADPDTKTFSNFQHFDFEALCGRLLSSSYAPDLGQPGHTEMIAALRGLFEAHQREGKVTFEYDTIIYCGRL